MFSVKKTVAVLALIGTVATGGAAFSQELEAGLGDALMAMDGSTPGAGISAASGWLTCSVIRTGAGWGNHYVALTCPSGPFSNKWHVMKDDQKDAMLATALAASTSNNKVQVYVATASSGYNVIRALYLQK